jgi:hypothetical protein
MTVKELINELLDMPQYEHVLLEQYGGGINIAKVVSKVSIRKCGDGGENGVVIE